MVQAKATKRFEKNHLKHTLGQRKVVKKHKQLIASRRGVAGKGKKRVKDSDYGAEEKAGRAPKEGLKIVEDMSLEDFFDGGFQLPELSGAKEKRKRPDTQENEDDDTSDANMSNGESSGSSIASFSGEEPEPKLKRAKLTSKKAAEDEMDLDLGSDSENLSEDDIRSNGITMNQVEQWREKLHGKSPLKAIRETIVAFKSAAHLNESDEEKAHPFAITDPDVYHAVIMLALKDIPKALGQVVPVKETASGRTRLPTDTAVLGKITTLLKKHTTSMLHLLSKLPSKSDDNTTSVVLQSLTSVLPYILSFRKHLREIILSSVSVWTTHPFEPTRIAAFLCLRRLCVIGDIGLREAVLKGSYTGMIKGSRSGGGAGGSGAEGEERMNLVKNSLVDLYGLDEKLSYTLGFTYIRQAAVHLRNSITNNSKESFKLVYNWQYVNSLDFWSRALSTHCDMSKSQTESPLKPLIYPLVQVSLGAMRLIPSSQYFPLRFYLIRSLLRISRQTGTFIPLAPQILEVLNSVELKSHKPKPSTLLPLDFSTHIRAPSSYLKTRVYQDGCGDQVVELLQEFYALYAGNIAFPELALPVVMQVKRLIKKSVSASSGRLGVGNIKLNTALKLVVDKLDANSHWIEERRRVVQFSPENLQQVRKFEQSVDWEKQSPLMQFVAGQRVIRERNRKLIAMTDRQERSVPNRN